MFPNLFGCRVQFAGVAALILFSLPAFGESISLQPSADTTLFEVEPDKALGGADFFNAGTAANSSRNRALLYFDFTGLIPAGAQITSVLLSMDVVRQPAADSVSSSFSLRRVFSSWGEGSVYQEDPLSPGKGGPAAIGNATWNHRSYNDTAWSSPGGAAGIDFSTEISSDTIVYGLGDLVMFENTPRLVSDVEFWVEHPELNFGWMLMTETEGQRRTARSFASRESGYGPTMIIDFVVVPEPATWWLVGLASAGVWLARRRR